MLPIGIVNATSYLLSSYILFLYAIRAPQRLPGRVTSTSKNIGFSGASFRENQHQLIANPTSHPSVFPSHGCRKNVEPRLPHGYLPLPSGYRCLDSLTCKRARNHNIFTPCLERTRTVFGYSELCIFKIVRMNPQLLASLI